MSSTSPITRIGQGYGSPARHLVIHQGIRPATTPGASTKKTDDPRAAPAFRPACEAQWVTMRSLRADGGEPYPPDHAGKDSWTGVSVT